MYIYNILYACMVCNVCTMKISKKMVTRSRLLLRKSLSFGSQDPPTTTTERHDIRIKLLVPEWLTCLLVRPTPGTPVTPYGAMPKHVRACRVELPLQAQTVC